MGTCFQNPMETWITMIKPLEKWETYGKNLGNTVGNMGACLEKHMETFEAYGKTYGKM